MQKVITKYLGADSCYSAWIWKKGTSSALGFWSIVAFQGQICRFCLIRFGTFRNILRQHINSKAPAPCGTTDTHLDRPSQPWVARLSAVKQRTSWSVDQFDQRSVKLCEISSIKINTMYSNLSSGNPSSIKSQQAYSFVHSFLPSEHLQTLEPLKISCYNCWMLILIQLRWLALLCCWPCLYCNILSGCFDVSWPRTSCNPLNTRPRQIIIYIYVCLYCIHTCIDYA